MATVTMVGVWLARSQWWQLSQGWVSGLHGHSDAVATQFDSLCRSSYWSLPKSQDICAQVCLSVRVRWCMVRCVWSGGSCGGCVLPYSLYNIVHQKVVIWGHWSYGEEQFRVIFVIWGILVCHFRNNLQLQSGNVLRALKFIVELLRKLNNNNVEIDCT